MRVLNENNIIEIPILLEHCELPIFMREKLYVDFTSDFEKGFDTLIQPLKKLVLENIGRLSDDDQITDYAVNWG